MATSQDAIRRLTIVAEDRGIEQTTAKIQKLSAATDGVTVADQRLERAQQSVENAFMRAQRRYDDVARAQMQLAQVERVVNQARLQGVGTEAERIRLLDAATAAINRQTTALGRMRAAQGQAMNDNSAAGRRQVLGYQAFDIGQGIAAGTPLAMIAVQQGPQIAQLYAAQGGLNALWKDAIGILGGVARAAGPWIAAVGLLYGAYKVLASFSADSALQIDAATQALADQAAPIGTVQAGIGELSRLQKTYQDTIRSTGDVHSAATDKIIANTKREFEARKALLELESIRQEAAIKANEAAISQQGLELRRGVTGDLGPWYNPYGGSNGVNTNVASPRWNFLMDPRLPSVAPFRLPDDITGVDRTQEIIEKSPVFQKIRELRAEGELTRLTFQALQEALKATFDGQQLIKDATPTNTSGLPLTMTPPGFRGIDDQPGSVQFYEDAIKLGERRILQLDQERQMIGLVGAELAAAEYVQRLVNDAVAKNIQLGAEQVAALKEQAIAIGKATDELAKLKLQQDLTFDREQLFRSAGEQSIAARLRNTGIGMDSAEAQWMRDNQRFSEAKELADGFLTTFQQELLRNGGDIGDALGKAILNAATNAMNKQWEAIFDRLANWFASALTGVKPGGGLGNFVANTTLSNILGAGAASDNFAPPRALSGIGSPGTAKIGMSAFRDAIASIESAGSGGYSALGPIHKTMGQALGRYQIMEANLSSWSQAALGRNVTRAEFMANPSLQDQIFDHRFGGYVDKYGASGAASMWFTGRPNAPNARDVLGTSGSQYVDKFNVALDKASSSVGSFDTGITNAVSKVTEMGAKWFGSDEMWKSLASPDFKPNTTLSAILGYGGGGGGGAMGGGGGLGFLGSLFSSIFSLFGFANGTENAPAGWAWVGERGPELRKLRAGDVIRSNGRSQQMAANGNQGGQGKVEMHVHINGANGDDHVRKLARQGAQQAISEYHDSQVNGGFGETQRAYSSQKG